MVRKIRSFRVGKVTVYLRGKVWYLCYYEHGQRRRPRVGPDKESARKLAAQTNAQIEMDEPTVLGFEPIGIADLRERWLHYHEHVLAGVLLGVALLSTTGLMEEARCVYGRLKNGWYGLRATLWILFVMALL